MVAYFAPVDLGAVATKTAMNFESAFCRNIRQ